MRKLIALSALVVLSAASAVLAQEAKPTRPSGTLPPTILEKRWTYDFDGIWKRRMMRVLVPYSKTLYFVDKGQQRGIAYDAFKLFEDDLNKKKKKGELPFHVVFIPTPRGDLMQALVDGRGDVAMGYLTITEERRAQVDFTNPTARNVSEIVVTGPGQPPLKSKEDLSGRELYVRKDSSYHDSLEELNAELKKAGKPPVRIREAPDNLEAEDVLEMVNAGLVQATVVDDFRAKFWKQVFTKIDLHEDAALRTGGEMAWMIRKNSPLLKKELNDVLARYPEGSSIRNQLLARYLKNTKFVKNATSKQDRAKFDQVVQLFKKYCDQYDMDTLLMAAQGYQESRLDQNAKSHVGAVGVMQVMPATGQELKVGDINKIDPNIHAGVKYVRFMMDKYYANEPMSPLNRGLFTFASYNAGPARIAQLRKIAKERGLDPNIWFGNVEQIASEKIGRETVTYVSNIYKYYLAYQLVTEQQKERDDARKAVQTAAPKK
ncbi:MAG TPA: transporter substrate-binding domain-containing protein [Thermoanaerobaculia bacterium]|nr:transporter substrate-binding domain-containing protein [Thermoanaerobaculia bacterium]